MGEKIINIVTGSFWDILIPGLVGTIPLSVISFTFALIIAVIVAMIQAAKIPVLKNICRFYIWIFRGTPVLVQLFLAFFGLPKIGITLDAFTAAVIVFSLNVGAYASETMRASIESVPQGQMEAGLCVGMSYVQIMFRIILPQAFRVAVPSLFNTLISLVKDTSLASIITFNEMMYATKKVNARIIEPLVLYSEAAVFYLIFSTVLTKLQSMAEKKLGSYGGN